MLTVVLTWSILIWKQMICKREFQEKSLYQFRNTVQKALSVSFEMFSVGNKRRIVPLPAAPYWTAGCITIKSLGSHEVHKVLEHLQAQMLSTEVRWEDHSLRGSNKRQREHVRLWCRALKALHITTQPLNLNYSDTPNTQKVSELVSERYFIRCTVSCNGTHWIQPPMEYKEDLCFSYHYRIIRSIPKKPQYKNWSGSKRVFKVCSHFSPKEQVKARWKRASLGHTQETQAVLRCDRDSCTYRFTVSPSLRIL